MDSKQLFINLTFGLWYSPNGSVMKICPNTSLMPQNMHFMHFLQKTSVSSWNKFPVAVEMPKKSCLKNEKDETLKDEKKKKTEQEAEMWECLMVTVADSSWKWSGWKTIVSIYLHWIFFLRNE